MIQTTQNLFDSAFRSVVDSEHGLGALHSIPMRIFETVRYLGFDTRPGQMVTSLAFSWIAASASFDDEEAVGERLNPWFLLGASIPILGVEYLFRTHCFLKPLDSALAKTICARALVRLADIAACTATLVSLDMEDPQKKASSLQASAGAAWLFFRLYDIWAGENQLAVNLTCLDFMPHEGFGALRVQQFRNFVDSAFRYAVESKYGLGAIHALPLKVVQSIDSAVFETRLGRTTIHLGLPAIIACTIAASDSMGGNLKMKELTGWRHFIAYGICFGYLHYFWATRLFFKPLDSALVKSIAARSVVSGLDQVALFATVGSGIVPEKGKAGIARSTLGALWLTARLADIWVGKNQIAFRLVHLDVAPLTPIATLIWGLESFLAP